MNEKQVRKLVHERADGLCERCGSGYGQTLHHRKKRSHLPKKDQWQVSNCAMLCGDGTRGCHGWVEANPNKAELEGWHCRPWVDPELLQVRYQQRWAWLKPDGTVGFE